MVRPKDEWQAISLSYTSEQQGNPKGVVYHHRGSYLMSMGSGECLEYAKPPYLFIYGSYVSL